MFILSSLHLCKALVDWKPEELPIQNLTINACI